MIQRIFRVLIVAASISISITTFAQTKPTRLVVGFPPGGPIDAVARIISEQLGRELGQVVVVENRTGANAGIAAEFVAKSTPDGSTLLISTAGAMTISPSLYDKLAADPFRDLTPVSLVVNTDEVLVTSANNPANTVLEFIAIARSRKDGATLASSGIGSVPHLAMELLDDVTKANLRHVPYKGVAPAITDVIAGHVDGIFIDFPVALGHIRASKLKALGLAAPKRHPLLPEAKTLEEMGIKGVDSNNWYGIFAPKGTSAADIDRLNHAIRRSLESEAVKSRLLAIGLIGAPSSPAALATLQKADFEKWASIIKIKGIKGE